MHHWPLVRLARNPFQGVSIQVLKRNIKVDQIYHEHFIFSNFSEGAVMNDTLKGKGRLQRSFVRCNQKCSFEPMELAESTVKSSWEYQEVNVILHHAWLRTGFYWCLLGANNMPFWVDLGCGQQVHIVCGPPKHIAKYMALPHTMKCYGVCCIESKFVTSSVFIHYWCNVGF